MQPASKVVMTDLRVYHQFIIREQTVIIFVAGLSG